jgi:hypothetical protein
MIILKVLLALFIFYEIHKLVKFNFFYKIKSISIDYYKQVTKKVNSVAYKQLIKISIFDFIYMLVTFIMLFTYNFYFALGIIILSLLQHVFFKYIKNKTLRKTAHLFDGIISIILLSLCLINIYFYNVNGIELIDTLIKLI